MKCICVYVHVYVLICISGGISLTYNSNISSNDKEDVLCRYVNQPEPELQGSSVTLKATEDRIQHMQREADQIWPPELAQLMKVQP